MKKLLAIASFIIILTMVFGTAQVYASAEAERKGPNPNASNQPDRKATQQAENSVRQEARATEQAARVEVRATDKAERVEEKLAGKKYHFRGEVVAVDAASLTIKLKTGEEMVFALTETTSFKIPTLGSATWEQLNVGVQVVVQAVKTAVDPAAPVATEAVVPAADEFTAVKVQVVPGKPVRIHRVGMVTAYTAGESITILAKDGQEYTFELSETTKILPEERVDLLVVGAKVTIISRRDPTGGPLVAQGIVVHPAEDDDDEEGTPTVTSTATPTFTPTVTPTATPTDTPTNTPTNTPTETPTNTPTETPTNTPTNTPTFTETTTETVTETATP